MKWIQTQNSFTCKNSTFPHTLHSASLNVIIQYISIVPRLQNWYWYNKLNYKFPGDFPYIHLWLLSFGVKLFEFYCAYQFSSVQLLSRDWLFETPWIAAHQGSLSITNSRSSLKLISIELVMPSSHLILCHPPFLLPLIPPSIRVFSNESTLHMRWPKYWSLSFSIIPSKEHPGLVSFRMDWLDLLAVQGTLKSPSTPQFKSINSSVLSFLHSPTFTSIHDYWKNHSFD